MLNLIGFIKWFLNWAAPLASREMLQGMYKMKGFYRGVGVGGVINKRKEVIVSGKPAFS